MGLFMTSEPSDLVELRRRIERGDESALVELFTRHRDRLKRMVKLRLDRRLQGRIDASDVLQEAYHRRRSAGRGSIWPARRCRLSSGCAGSPGRGS